MHKQIMEWCCLGLAGWLWAAGVPARTIHLYYTDPQGTVLAKTDAQGNILARYDYRPYGGVVSGAEPNGAGYTGHVQDPETGLVYMQARYYDPVSGRFLSVDILKPKSGNLYSVNVYLYANANPMSFIDPFGNDPKHGKDMDICTGPVPCDSNSAGGAGNAIRNKGYEKLTEQVFQNYTYAGGKIAIASNMPEEVKTALIYIIGSPLGKPLVAEALRTGRAIGLLELPKGRYDFRYDAGSGLIFYTLNLAEYKAGFANTRVYNEVKDTTFDVILMHEIGHSPVGRAAFHITSHPATQLDEFEDIRKVENPYRKFYGVPLRTSSNGFDLP